MQERQDDEIRSIDDFRARFFPKEEPDIVDRFAPATHHQRPTGSEIADRALQRLTETLHRDRGATG
jgi:hypothetical protein